MKFASNIALSTLHNYITVLEKGEKRSYRVSLKVVEGGPRAWRFRYENIVDSTYADGSESRADMPGGLFRVVSCDVNGKQVIWPENVFEPLGAYVSEPLELDIPENGRLIFTWTLEALEDNCVIPGTPDSIARTYASSDGVNFTEQEFGALPAFFEAERDCSLKMAFMGDSITQGCLTRIDMCEQWAARIALAVSRDIAVHNIGLGYGRCADAAKGGAWLKKAAEYDIVNLCFGVNDILHGSQSADVLKSDLSKTVSGLRQLNPSVRIILFTVPPFDMDERCETIRRTVNASILANAFGADAVYDISNVLSCPAPDDGAALFGGHPDWRGGAAVCGDYISRFMRENFRLFNK